MISTVLTQRGYSIPKCELSVADMNAIKKDLTISPAVPGAPVQSRVTFPAYRESLTKVFVPRCYGVNKFGPPQENRLPKGDDISLAFVGTLKAVQQEVVDTFLSHVEPGGGCGLIQLPCGFGKTVVANFLIAALKKKTLIIVNTEMLLNQWIERIRQFLPDARVGTIRGPTVDVDNKDIVIGMLMSLSVKDYPVSTFAPFGFVVVDEVHHIASETFSRSLFKNSTFYMLGLSATMDRKDGTTYLFKMFLGDVVAKRERPKDDGVIVRGAQFLAPEDEDFSEVEVDFRGTTASAKMVGKISSYAPRCEFILRLLTEMLVENGAQQILLLGQHKVLLKYLFEAISSRSIATVGNYLGGMKKAALAESETKQIILATYTMAAEGLDIPTLTTLVMGSPMTSVEQPVGRILRRKHDFPPLVVDVVDGHSNFQNQWRKRCTFYRSQGYDIYWRSMADYEAGAGWDLMEGARSRGASKRRKPSAAAVAEEKEDEETSAALMQLLKLRSG